MRPKAGAGGRPQAVLFDWDNTLVDNWGVIRDAMNATLTAFGQAPWSQEETRRRVARSAREGFPGLFGARWREAQALFYERFVERHLEALAPIDGAEPMLAALHGEGIYLGVVSNKRGDLLRREAGHLGWQGYFGRIVGAADAAQDKPAIAPVELALEGSGIARGPAVWLVGDGAIDLECARNAGCIAVLIGDGGPGGVDPAAPGPDLRAADCLALTALVRNR